MIASQNLGKSSIPASIIEPMIVHEVRLDRLNAARAEVDKVSARVVPELRNRFCQSIQRRLKRVEPDGPDSDQRTPTQRQTETRRFSPRPNRHRNSGGKTYKRRTTGVTAYPAITKTARVPASIVLAISPRQPAEPISTRIETHISRATTPRAPCLGEQIQRLVTH